MRKLVVTILAILLSTISVPVQGASAETNAKQYWDTVLYENSTHIFTGYVLSVDSKYVEVNGSKSINSYALISVTERIKGETENQITIVYEGGTVGDTTLAVFGDPWGVIECHVGDQIKAFTKQEKATLFKAIDVETINGIDKEASTLSAYPYIYEDYRAGFAYHQGYDYDGGNPFEYWINQQGTRDIDPGPNDEFDAVQKSFQTWEDVSQSYKDYTYMGTTSISEGIDDINVVCWINEGPSEYVAEAHVRIYGGKFHECDIVFNDYYTWAIGSVSGTLDVQNVGTHEVGHTLCIQNLVYGENSEKTMYAYISFGETKKRDLDWGDKAGIQYLYPQYEQPTVVIETPYGGQEVDGVVGITIDVGSSSGINWAQYHAFDAGYSSNWVSMTYTGEWIGWWDTTWLPNGWYKLFVRAESGQSMLGYDLIEVYVKHQ